MINTILAVVCLGVSIAALYKEKTLTAVACVVISVFLLILSVGK